MDNIGETNYRQIMQHRYMYHGNDSNNAFHLCTAVSTMKFDKNELLFNE